MSYQLYELVRLERDLRLARARSQPPASPDRRPPRRPRAPRRRRRPLLQAHEYLELEFAVEDRR